MSYNLFLDDDPSRSPALVANWMNVGVRHVYRENLWERVWNYDEFVNCITTRGLPEIVSFDHDLADEHYAPTGISYDEFKDKTGYHCMQWMIQYIMDNNLEPPEVHIHSLNPVGAENIETLFKNFIKHYKWDTSKESNTQMDK